MHDNNAIVDFNATGLEQYAKLHMEPIEVVFFSGQDPETMPK